MHITDTTRMLARGFVAALFLIDRERRVRGVAARSHRPLEPRAATASSE
jgi:hypothetical protein